MRIVIFLSLFLSLFGVTRGQEVLTEVNLTVNGIRSGTSYKWILKRLGKPQREKKIGIDDCADGFIKTAYYRGLTIGLLSDAKGKSYKVISMKITSSRWLISPSVRIGANRAIVRNKYGRPNSQVDNTLNYVTKENLGLVTFYFKGAKLISVEMQETLC